jgi:predicted alpha/beta superfamily hydrolase
MRKSKLPAIWRRLEGWRVDGLRLERGANGTHEAVVTLPSGEVLLYKVSLGSWQGVDKDAAGKHIPNRQPKLGRDTLVEIQVSKWGWGEAPRRRSSLTGEFRYHREFRSEILDNQRTLIVWLPPGYSVENQRRFPVLYLHDGQNVFDAATAFLGVEWEADETAERLIRARRIHPVILVGIYNNAERIAEYTPWRDSRQKAGGRGKLYARFLAEEVKPFIDGEYRTLRDREHTGVAGSSLGGLISLFIASQYHDRFGMCAAVSPALWWANERMTRELGKSPDWMKTVRFWIDMGTREGSSQEGEGSAIAATRRLVERLEKARLVPGRDYYYWEVYGGEHNEANWAARFDKLLLFFFGK